MNSGALFLVMEVDLDKRFTFFENYSGLPSHRLKLKNKLHMSKIKTIFSRLNYKRHLEEEYAKLKSKLQKTESLFISNPEGFIAKNIISFIRRDFPSLQIISLQHGIFALKKESQLKKILKRLINLTLNPIVGYYPIGDGFGDRTTDKYIVYNSLYKSYLLKNGWKNDEVKISSFLLKGEKPINANEQPKGRKAIFFLQCMSKLGISNVDFEKQLIARVCQLLCCEYDEVLIKQHPYAEIELPILDKKCLVVEHVPPVEELGIVVSAFSTALLEYEKFGIPCVAIKSEKLNVDSSIYEQFLFHFDYDNNNSNEFVYVKNEKRKDLPVFFEPGITDLEQL